MKVKELRGKTIGFAASGGLDSCTITQWLTDSGVDVVCMTADLGQPDEADLSAIQHRMFASGAKDWVLLDAKEALVEHGLALIQAQSCYEGRYWNTTGIARYVTTAALLKEMRKRGIGILSHGATGRGNDQVRFQVAANMLAPEVEVYAPWRDDAFLERFGGRSAMIEFCLDRKIPITASKQAPYSTDANILGLTHEAGRLESLETPATFITPGMGTHPGSAPEIAESVSIEFREGRPTTLNGRKLSLVELFDAANRVAGKHGVGIGTHLIENRFVGIKSRGVYESPGMELLGSAYEFVLQAVLDRRAKELFDELSRCIAKQVYQGFWYDLGTRMALAGIRETSRLVTGRITVSLYKGRVSFESMIDVPHSLYSETTSSMEDVGMYDHRDSEGLLRVLGVSARASAAAGQVSPQDI